MSHRWNTERRTGSRRSTSRRTAVGVAWGVALTLLGCESGLAAAAVQSGAITGSVVAGEDGQPVPEAAVVVEGSHLVAVTNGLGRFEIEAVPVGEVVLIVRAAGFVELRTAAVPVTVGAEARLRLQLAVTPNDLDRTQVTAGKAPARIGDVAGQTDVVDRSTWEARGDQHLTQAISHLPGVFISTRDGSFESALLRGLPRGSREFTSTLLLVDGVPQTDWENGAQVVNLPIADAKRIEVVRGPAAALYGRSAIGGVVNVRTADPTPEHQAGLDVAGGGFGFHKGVARASGPLAERAGYYVSASSERSTGFYTGPFDFNAERTSLFAKTTLAPDSKSFASATVQRVVSAQSLPTPVPIVDGRFLSDVDPRFDRLTNLNVEGPNYRRREGRYTASYIRAVTDSVRLVNVFGYRRVEYGYLGSGSPDRALRVSFDVDLAARTLTQDALEMEGDEDSVFAESRVEIDSTLGSTKTSMIAGASHERATGSTGGGQVSAQPGTAWRLDYLNPVPPARSGEWQVLAPSDSDYHSGFTGLFGRFSLVPTRGLILSAGGRYDRLDLDRTLTYGTGQHVTEASSDAFSPDVSVVVELLPEDASADIDAYVRYSQAFGRLPAGYEVEFDPEEIGSYELGVKGRALGGRVSFGWTYFDMKRAGIVVWVRERERFFPPVWTPANTGEHDYRGVEAGADWTVTRRLSLYGNAGLYRNRYGFYVDDAWQFEHGGPVLSGNRLPMAPDRVINVGAVITPVPRVAIRVDVKHVGDVVLDPGNSFALDPYTLFDAAVSWRRGPMRITLAAHNLLDQAYYWHGDPRAGWAEPGAPRQVLLTTSFRFR